MSTKPNHKPRPCRLHSQGQYYRFGSRCKFSHDLAPDPRNDRSPSERGILPEIANPTDLSIPSSSSMPPDQRSTGGISDARPRPKRGEIPCRAWKAGTCTKGSKCWFGHGVQARKPESESIETNKEAKSLSSLISSQLDAGLPSPLQTDVSSEQSRARHEPRSQDCACRYWKAGSCKQGAKCQLGHGHESQSPHSPAQQAEVVEAEIEFDRKAEAAAAREAKTAARKAQKAIAAREAQATAAREVQATTARVRARQRAREEAAKTMTQVVLGSIVTYSAGPNIPSLITGFETCTLHVKNLPLNVREDEVHDLFTQRGMDIQRFHLVGINQGSREKLEAHIVSDADAGRALAEMLDGLYFKEETLAVEMSANNTQEGMSAAASRDSEVLTIFWRVPSVRYVAGFLDMAAANEKVRQLDGHICAGRRVKVEINTPPPDCIIRDFWPSSIKINFLRPSITDEEVIAFTGSSSVKRLASGGRLGGISVEETAHRLRNDIERAVPNALRQFDPPSGSPSPEGVVSARAHFSSWDDARAAHISLSDKRYGNQPTWFKLPDPMHFTITIPSEKYLAQKAQWDGLLSSIKFRKACILNIHNSGDIVRIRLSGSIKEAIGALKVRVENLARGEPVDGWHPCLGFSNNPFPHHVFLETGAYLRADWKRQSLKVYGASRAIDQARDLTRSELEKLASIDYTVTLAKSSVGFFVRAGIPQLKETLGENNITRSAMLGGQTNVPNLL
ncbi:hypothetical protein OG21DRAFT_289426 [Imleria badia]|nr:hypothetical protein OG21DRAFT_289426 [Imleria badia]